MANLAKAQTVFAMFCASNDVIVLMDCEAIALRRGMSIIARLANAQDVFDRFCEPNSCIFGMAEAESADIIGLSMMPSAAKDQAGSARS